MQFQEKVLRQVLNSFLYYIAKRFKISVDGVLFLFESEEQRKKIVDDYFDWRAHGRKDH